MTPAPSLADDALPLVTIAIPTYNRAGQLQAALDSALAQDYPRLQVLVSDNASTDGTAALLAACRDPRLQVVRQATNIGLIGNWNACLGGAAGAYILVLSDDDALLPGALRRLVAPLAEPSADQVAFVYGRCIVTHEDDGSTHLSPDAPPRETSAEFQAGVLSGRRIGYPSATLLRREDALACGGYDARFAAAVDIGLLFRLANGRGRVAFVSEPTTRYSLHPANFTAAIALPTLAATMSELGRVASQGSATGAVTPDAVQLRTFARAPAKAVGDVICERHRRRTLGTRAALSTLLAERATFFAHQGLSEWAKAVAKVSLRGLMRRSGAGA